MLQDPVFTDESTEEDLTLARALIAERSPEEIASALARIYRSRLPSPEELSEATQGKGLPRSERDERREARRDDTRGNRNPHHAERGPAARPERPKPGRREGLSGGSVWFRTNVGRKKNAEARWLLPMICRRGGIEKHDIGAIRIYETSSEFEISGDAAEQFALFIKRPDKEEHIRIEPLPDGPRAPESSERAAATPAGESPERPGKARWKDRPRYGGGPKPHGKAPGGDGERNPSHAGKHRRDDGTAPAKPEFRKKKKKNKKSRKGD
jgi:ATP-dependent RNA helicase DeaD